MRRSTTGWLLAAFLGSACGGGSEEHTYQTGIETAGEESVSHDGPGIDEGEAVNIAMNLADAEGHDAQAYTDVVVHTSDDGQWVVQLRRPRLLRFIEVVVDKSSGKGVLTVRSSSADG